MQAPEKDIMANQSLKENLIDVKGTVITKWIISKRKEEHKNATENANSKIDSKLLLMVTQSP
jgi:hypothetical protein